MVDKFSRMTGFQATSGVALALCLMSLGVLPAPKSPVTFEIPAPLKSEAPEIPADRNNLTRFLAAFDPEKTKGVRDALERLKSGKGVDDKPLLGELLGIHRQADDMLKPPLAFTQSGPPVAIKLFQMFQGTDVLARQAMIENDYPRADRIIGDMLRWSRLLRNGQANQMQWSISLSGWNMAFDTLIQDLPGNPDKPGRLAEVEKLFRENRIETPELIECLKIEARWWEAHGGLRKLLEGPDGNMMTVFLRAPFNDISCADLLTLPYDVKADFGRDMNDMLGTLDCLKRNVPISSWPDFEVPATGQTLEDYRKRPNGLGDLFHEQQGFAIQSGFWASALSRNRLLEACFMWLKQELNGARVSDDSFREILDPVDGKPMAVDLRLRTIRSRGPNRKVDPPDPGAKPLSQGGFRMSGDDIVVVVPR